MPSIGGTDCGGAATCTTGSVAGITEMNTYMDDWVCQALANGTNYFWFEAFDEPWKIQFDTPGEEWEDHWGLMDVNRNLKPGVTIPSCGGKTVS
jgi:exo-beta-1,3-glucanase (GH17 family)